MAPLMKRMNVMTFNCKSIQSNDRLLALQMELSKLKKFDVLGLAETWLPGQTCSRLSSGEYLYNSGKTGDARFSGTGLLISAEMNQRVIGVKYVSDRIIQILLKLRTGKTLRITQVYAPQSGRAEDEYEMFLDQLSSSLARPSTYDVVLGDFNASTGPRENGERYIGKYSWDTRSERGELLCQFCVAHQLYLMNGFFKKGRNRRWTWHSPDRSVTKEIDHVLSKKKNIIEDVNVISRLPGSDHRMVRTTVSLPIRAGRSRPFSFVKPEYEKIPCLISMILKLQYQPTAETPEAELNLIKQALLSTAKECAHQPTIHARLSPETLQLMERRRQMNHAIRGDARARIEYAELSKLIRKCFKADLDKYYEKVMGKAIEENRIKRGRSEMVQKQNQMIHLQRTDGAITESVAELMEEIARFYNDLYSSEAGNPVHDRDPNVALQKITAAEIVAASRRMKGNTAPGADNIPSKVVKSTISTFVDRFAAALHGLFEEENMPPELFYSKTILLYKKGNRLEIGNYRPISLLPVLYKLIRRKSECDATMFWNSAAEEGNSPLHVSKRQRSASTRLENNGTNAIDDDGTSATGEGRGGTGKPFGYRRALMVPSLQKQNRSKSLTKSIKLSGSLHSSKHSIDTPRTPLQKLFSFAHTEVEHQRLVADSSSGSSFSASSSTSSSEHSLIGYQDDYC